MRHAAPLIVLLLLPIAPLLAQTTPGTVFGGTQQSTPAPAASTAASGAAASTGTAAAPANPETPDFSVPQDKKDTWVAAFSVLREEGVSPENEYLASSVPLLLKNQLAGISTHALSAEERDLARKAAVAREINAVNQSVTSLRQQRDAQYIDTEPPSASTIASLDKRIAAALARRDFLASMDVSRVTVKEQKAVVIKEGSGAGKLLDAPDVPPAVFCAKNGLDLLVGGTIREVEGYILVDLWAFDPLRGTYTLTYRDANVREEVYASLGGIGKELSGLFLGRPWASIAFSPDPPNSSLYVDGTLAATGKMPTLYLAPGQREIRISAPGYRDITRTLTLSPEEETSLDVTLEKEAGGTLVISSTPAGADVYVESVWKGKTPLALEKPFERSRVVLSDEGYYDQEFSINADSPPEVSFTLQPSAVSREAIRKKARDEFYQSFMWFALSLPIPFFSYGLALDKAVEVNQLGGSGPQAANAQTVGNMLYYGGYIGGTVLSVSLFTWMVFKIIHYVTVSTRSAG